MSGVTPLVDTLLATRLGQRVDLVPLKPQVEIAGPGAVTDVEKVINEVRLPSREALLRQLGPGVVSDDADGAQALLAQKTDKSVTLSNAARVVSAILNLPAGATPAVRGAVALWPDAKAPVVPALAAALARTVSGSGLFYESHLQQYAAGTRTLAQMAQEPQAGLRSTAKPATRLPALTPIDAGLPGAGSKTAGGASRPDVLLPASPHIPSEQVDLPAGEGEPLSVLQSADTAPPAEETGAEAVVRNATHATGDSSPLPAPRSAALESAGLAAYTRAGQPEVSVHRFDEPAAQEPLPEDPGVNSAEASSGGDPVAALHPETMALVRQQLEMLAQPTFRWSGEGWPGVPMDWEIHEERDGSQDPAEDGQGDAALEAPDSTWVTRLAMQLPRLGAVDMRLSLNGTALHLHLAAVEAATVAQFNAVRDELPRRFDALGLQLAELKISQPATDAAAPNIEGHDDAA